LSARRVAGILAAIATTLSVAAMLVYSQTTPPPTRDDDRGAPFANLADEQGQTVRVQVATPTRRTMERWVELPGTLAPYFAADLYTKESGYVRDVLVDLGDSVKAGDVLLTLDVPEMADEMRQQRAALQIRQAELTSAQAKESQAKQAIPRAHAEARRAKAELDLRHITAQRKEALGVERVIPQQELDEARAALAIAESAVEVSRAKLAEMNAEMLVYRAAIAVCEGGVSAAEASIGRMETLAKYTTVTAPFDGLVTERLVDPGAFVRSAGNGGTAPVLRLARHDRLRLIADVAEPDAPFVTTGTLAILTIGATTLQATVSRFAASLRPETRTMRAEIDIENPQGRLLAGAYVKVRLALVSHADALVLPTKSVRSTAGRSFVLIDKVGRAEEVFVQLGYNDGAFAEIVSGIRGDEKVILSAVSGVKAGTPIESVLVESVPGGKP